MNSLPSLATGSQRPFDTYTEKAQEQALRRKAYIDAWLSQNDHVFTPSYLNPMILRIAARIGDPFPPSPSTFYRWAIQFKSSDGEIVALLPAYEKRGPKARLLSEEAKSICKTVINDYYLTKQRLSIKEAYKYLIASIKRGNADLPCNQKIKRPSYDTFRRLIRDMDKYEVDLVRYGREYVNKKYRHSYITEQAYFLLERIEADHTPLNIFIVDDNNCTDAQAHVGTEQLVV